MNPLVSVVIPTYNGAKYILKTVESALAQTYHPIEILVVDDGSKDSTEDVLKPLMNRIRFIKKDNGGPASARNRGIQESRGELIAFLDGDDLWSPDKLEKQVKILIEQKAGLVYADVSVIDLNDHPINYHVNKARPQGRIFKELFSSNFIPTSTVVVRKSCLDHVGCFNESFRCVEDYDLWLRVSAEYEIARVAEALVKYRRHEKNLSSNIDPSYLNEKQILEIAIQKWQDRFSFLKESQNKRFAVLYFDWGMEYWERSNWSKCRECWRKSIALYPWSLRVMKFYVSAVLGPGWINLCRKLKGSHVR